MVGADVMATRSASRRCRYHLYFLRQRLPHVHHLWRWCNVGVHWPLFLGLGRFRLTAQIHIIVTGKWLMKRLWLWLRLFWSSEFCDRFCRPRSSSNNSSSRSSGRDCRRGGRRWQIGYDAWASSPRGITVAGRDYRNEKSASSMSSTRGLHLIDFADGGGGGGGRGRRWSLVVRSMLILVVAC